MTEAAMITTTPSVSKASSADVMNVLLQLRVDFASVNARHDTMLEGIKEQLKTLQAQQEKLSQAFSEAQAHNGVTREIVSQLQNRDTDKETRLRAVEKEMEELRDVRTALVTAQTELKALSQEVQRLKEQRAWLVGWGAGAGFVAAFLFEILMRYVIR